MKNLALLLLFSVFIINCSSDSSSNETPIDVNDDDILVTENYFPSITNNSWEKTSPESLGWNTPEIENLKIFLEENNTRGFIILKNGKIVLEEYWGTTFINTNFNEDSIWFWASAGKTLTSFLTGIAQDESFLNINDKTSDYLGAGWTSLPSEQENNITIKNQLTMTTGLDYTVDDLDCTNPECLLYKSDPNTQWFYHNGPYTLLESVISEASEMTYNNFTSTYLSNKIGITKGDWKLSTGGFNNVFWSTTKDAARFGLLLLNEGDWDSEPILNDKEYFESMTNSSQNLNPSYGYLTWLNGKSSISIPGFSNSFDLTLSENAPTDLYAALGTDGQFIDVIPSLDMVVIRLGAASTDKTLVPTKLHDEMWEYISAVLPN